MKVSKVYNVNLLCFIIHESWDIIWNNTNLVKHGSSVIQSERIQVPVYSLSWCAFFFYPCLLNWVEIISSERKRKMNSCFVKVFQEELKQADSS